MNNKLTTKVNHPVIKLPDNVRWCISPLSEFDIRLSLHNGEVVTCEPKQLMSIVSDKLSSGDIRSDLEYMIVLCSIDYDLQIANCKLIPIVESA